MKNVPVLILAGGKGTRLSSVVREIPKPMVVIGNKPVLEHTINIFINYGFKRFIFCVGHLANTIVDYFGDGSRYGVEIEYLFEKEDNLLGTAGAILPAKKFIDNTFVVTCADILRRIEVDEILAFHITKKSVCTINVYKEHNLEPTSMVVFDANNKINRFVERPSIDDLDRNKTIWTNASLYICQPDVFKYISKDLPQDFGKDVFPKMIKDDNAMFAFPSNDYLLDIGTIEGLNLAKQDIISRKYKPYDNRQSTI